MPIRKFYLLQNFMRHVTVSHILIINVAVKRASFVYFQWGLLDFRLHCISVANVFACMFGLNGPKRVCLHVSKSFCVSENEFFSLLVSHPHEVSYTA